MISSELCKVFHGITPEDLHDLSYQTIPTTNEYEILRLKKEGALLILYTSGKLVMHGDDSKLIAKLSKGIIGSDEVLKGDTFGGLVVVGAYFKSGEVDTLRDSKKLTDDQILRIANNLLRTYPDRFAIRNLVPEEYNSAESLTRLMNRLHDEVGEELKERFGEVTHIVDKFPGCTAGDVRMERAEDQSVAVAAASIVARKTGLEQLQELSQKAGFIVPKGSTHVEDAVVRLIREKQDLRMFVKLHFKNVKSISYKEGYFP